MRYTVEGHRRSHGIVYETARYDLLGLAKAGLLDARKTGRAFTFIVSADIAERLQRFTAQHTGH